MSQGIYELLEIKEELKLDTLRKLKLSEADLSDAVRIISEWFKVQPHLPQIEPDDRQIECLFIGSKGSIERTKQGLDMYYSIKLAAPEIFLNRDPLLSGIQNGFNAISFAIMRPTTPCGHRVVCCQFQKDTTNFNLTDFFKPLFMMLELRMRFDFAAGCIYVCEFSDFTLGHLTKMTPSVIKKALVSVQGPYLARIKGCHFVNAPGHSEPFIKLIKSLLSSKLRARLYFHQNMDSVYKVIDKSLLPLDFGGNLKSIKDHQDAWFKEAIKQRDWFLQEDKHVTEERRRTTAPIIDELFGIQGSFRKLNVD